MVSCCATKVGGRGWRAVIVWLFWAVATVITDKPYVCRAVNVLRSAWRPAAPPLSEPAMVNVLGGGIIINFYMMMINKCTK